MTLPQVYLFNYEDPADDRFTELYPLVETFAKDGIYQDAFIHLINFTIQ